MLLQAAQRSFTALSAAILYRCAFAVIETKSARRAIWRHVGLGFPFKAREGESQQTEVKFRARELRSIFRLSISQIAPAAAVWMYMG